MKTSQLALALLVFASAAALPAMAETRNLQEVAVEVDGVKFWLPSTIVVKKGDTVRIHAVSAIPVPASAKGEKAPHGFAIDAYKIQEVVDGKGKEITFVADKAGIFPMRCQLHPGHIGGTLVVQE